jgi:hypothetical protein
MSILESAEGRRRHLLDEKSHGDLDRMNSIIGGRPQQPESSAPTPRDHHYQKPPPANDWPQHQAYVSDRHAPSLSKPNARYRSPERSFAGPRRGRGSQAVEQDFDIRPPDHYVPDRPSFSAAVFGRRQRVRSPQPERPSGRISPRGMREAGARPRHGFFLNDPSQEPQCISAMRFNEPPRAVSNRHNEGQVRETIEWDPRNVGDRGPLWEPPPGASCRLSPIGALVQCAVCALGVALLQPYCSPTLRYLYAAVQTPETRLKLLPGTLPPAGRFRSGQGGDICRAHSSVLAQCRNPLGTTSASAPSLHRRPTPTLARPTCRRRSPKGGGSSRARLQ